MSACARPVGEAALVHYWLGDLTEAAQTETEEHLFACEACSRELAEIAALADAIRGLARAGAVRSSVTQAVLERLGRDGRRLRVYSAAPGDAVSCTVAPDDDVLVTRLAASLAGLERVDLSVVDASGAELERMRDLPVPAGAGEIVLAQQAQSVERFPLNIRMRLLERRAEGERVLGEYTFNHTPWHRLYP
jgi:anti-sigma factor RsiW